MTRVLCHGTNRSRTGFTLVEMLVAVAALSLIGLGLARVFSATGSTLTAGRRVSRNNDYLAMVERQLRRDFAAMSRDGFLVIRHRLAADGADMTLFNDPESPARPRRVDEIVFFQEGQFSTLRDPVNPARQPSGSAARLYLGHGLPVDPDSAAYLTAPRVDRPLPGAATSAPAFGSDGPSEFASAWTLVRHITALVTPTAKENLKPIPGIASDPFPDNDIQAGWQPAASSIFRWTAENTPTTLPASADVVRGAPVGRPLFAGGLVDLATTDLAQIRAQVLDAWPSRLEGGTYASAGSTDAALDNEVGGAGSTVDSRRRLLWEPGIEPGTLASPNYDSPTRRMQAWMIEALPVNSDQADEPRIRCEPFAPDYLGTLGSSGAEGVVFPAGESWRRSDQVMLASSNFVPGCSELIVEWSFGNVYGDTHPRRGELIWHGLRREVGSPGEVRPYLDSGATNAEREAMQEYVLVPSARPSTAAPNLLWNVPETVIHLVPPGANSDETLYSCFGYVDPIYPITPVSTLYPENIQWAWPRLIRLTMTLSDPLDPGRELTHEFVFEVPRRTNDAQR